MPKIEPIDYSPSYGVQNKYPLDKREGGYHRNQGRTDHSYR
jgi:hypothetical protein